MQSENVWDGSGAWWQDKKIEYCHADSAAETAKKQK
jgi:hypothetical protein